MVTYRITKNDNNVLTNDWAGFWYHVSSISWLRVVIMTRQNLSLGKCWKPFWATSQCGGSTFCLLTHFANWISLKTLYKLDYWKPDHWTMQFESFHRLSHHELWAIIPCFTNNYGKRTREFLGRFCFYFSLFFYTLEAFSIKHI